jgi:diguanylate cyclase (GGDEF)-like protein
LLGFGSSSYCYIQRLQPPYLKYEKQLNSNPDKVLELLKTDSTNTSIEKAQYHLVLSSTYYILVYPDKALKSAQEALSLISETSEPWLYHHIKLAESLAFDISGQAINGIEGVQKALFWSKSNNNKNLEISALVAMGHLLTSTTKYVSALNHLQKAYDMASIETKTQKGQIAGIIAVLYEERRENELSIPYFQESATYHREKNNFIELSIALYGLGRAYANIGKVEEGKQLLQESIDISRKVNDLQGIAYAQKELAGIFINEKKYKEALVLLKDALDVFESANNKFMLFDVHKVLAGLNMKTLQVDKAKLHWDKAGKYINEENQPLQNIAFEKLSAQIHAAEGDFEQAYLKLNQTMLKEKRFISKRSTQQLHLLRSEFELESKEKANQILAANNELQKIKLESESQKNQVLKLLFTSTLTILGLLGILIYRTRKHKLRFQHLANHDGLTGLYNRNHILEKLSILYEESKFQKFELNIAMIDLDHFKSINDTFGHSVGDQVLKHLASVFQNTLDKNDLCGRFGGEEFLIVIPKKSLTQAIETLEKIRLATLEINQKLGLGERITSLSTGICNCQNFSSPNINDMIKCADDALYQAKSNGRNTIITG